MNPIRHYYKPLAIIPLALLLAGCSKDTEIEQDPSVFTSHQDDGGGTPENGETTVKQCPKDLPGPTLVQLHSPDGTAYCMDRTEVTQRNYFAFLDTLNLTDFDSVMKTVKVPTFCDLSNMQLTLSPHQPPCDQDAIPSFDKEGNHLDHPIACIGWCAAYAYCAWAGKKLCGTIGSGSLDVADIDDPNKSQWYNACSQGGTSAYSYGDTYDENACSPSPVYRGDPKIEILPETVESHADRCRGTAEGFSEILNLSGSVREFEDSCVQTATGVDCTVRPSRVVDPESPAQDTSPRCDEALQTGLGPRTNVGFRCCLDL